MGYYIPDYMGDGKELDEQGFEMILREAKCQRLLFPSSQSYKSQQSLLGQALLPLHELACEGESVPDDLYCGWNPERGRAVSRGILHTEEKIRIARELDRIGVPILDVGMPSVSAEEREAILPLPIRDSRHRWEFPSG